MGKSYRIVVDASWCHTTGVCGYCAKVIDEGMMFAGDLGVVDNPTIAELMAIKRVISDIHNTCLLQKGNSVRIYTDCIVVTRIWSGKQEPDATYASLHNWVRTFASIIKKHHGVLITVRFNDKKAPELSEALNTCDAVARHHMRKLRSKSCRK